MVVYLLQQRHPLIGGIVRVATVKIAATSLMVFEDGGIPRFGGDRGMAIRRPPWGAWLIAA